MLAKKIAQALGSALIIVDVQNHFLEKMAPFEDYIEQIKELASKYAKVYQIHDTNDIQTPDYEFPNQQKVIPKQYGFDLQLEDVNMYFDTNDPASIMDIEAGTGVETKDGRYLLRTSGAHEWFLLEDDLYAFLKSLSGSAVDIIGGGEGECLTDVYEAALALGVKAKLLMTYVY